MPNRILVDVAPLRESREFRLLFVGTLVGTLGSQLTVVAIPYQVYAETHSSFQVGAVSLAQLVPLIVGALVGGSVGDAVDRRTLILITSVALALTSAGLAVNSLAAHPSVLAIYLISAVAAGLN
ncbi:MAG TPA: MFS transporter, partial [Acidimicrobiales bacterium]